MLACAQQKAVCCTLFRGDGLALVNHRASGRPKSGQPAPRRSHCRRLAGEAGCLQHLSTSRLHAMPRTPCCRRLCRLPTASSGKPRLHATTSQPNNVSVCRPKVAGDTIGRLDPRGTRRGDMNERQLVELACAALDRDRDSGEVEAHSKPEHDGGSPLAPETAFTPSAGQQPTVASGIKGDTKQQPIASPPKGLTCCEVWEQRHDAESSGGQSQSMQTIARAPVAIA